MPVYVAHGVINNINASSTTTLSVGFQPKAGVFWFVPVSVDTNEATYDNHAGVGFWAYINNSHVHRCHAAWRSVLYTSYVAVYTDCIVAVIGTNVRYSYFYVSDVSSTGLTITREGELGDSYRNWRVHWILFGGDVQVSCGSVSIPNTANWDPITVSGSGFDVLFSSFVGTQNSSPTNASPLCFCAAHHDKAANTYRYSTHAISQNSISIRHDTTAETNVKIYRSNEASNYIAIDNVNNNNDLRITRNYTAGGNSATFSYLSLRGIRAWSSVSSISSMTTSEVSRTYTFSRALSVFMALTSAWGGGASNARIISSALSAIFHSPPSETHAFSISKYTQSTYVQYIYDYSSSDQANVPHSSGSTNITSSYWRHSSFNIGSKVWNYATKSPFSSTIDLPIFILAMGTELVGLDASSNSQKSLLRRIVRPVTVLALSYSSALLSSDFPLARILAVSSESIAKIIKKVAHSLISSSGQTATLRFPRFMRLVANSSYVTSLKLLTKKLLTVASDYWVFIRLPLNMSQTLVAASNSLASLFKRLFVPLKTESEHESLIERTFLIILRAFSSWLAWMEFMIFKVLEVITDTRNDIEREVTNLFRTYEQELSALSSSVSEIAKTFFRELVAGAFQWSRMDRIRGPVFALRSWLWRVNRRKHGCQ